MIGIRSTANNNNKKKIKFPTVRGSIHIPGQTPMVQTVANSKHKLDKISLVSEVGQMKGGRFDKKPQLKIDMATPKISFKKFTQGSIPEINCERDKF